MAGKVTTPDPKPTSTELIHQYATVLQNIYDQQSAGDYTFIGVLSEFALEWDKLDNGY